MGCLGWGQLKGGLLGLPHPSLRESAWEELRTAVSHGDAERAGRAGRQAEPPEHHHGSQAGPRAHLRSRMPSPFLAHREYVKERAIVANEVGQVAIRGAVVNLNHVNDSHHNDELERSGRGRARGCGVGRGGRAGRWLGGGGGGRGARE